MSETANRLGGRGEDDKAEDAALEEARRRRRETLRICGGFGGLLGTYAAGSVAMGVVNDPVEDADGGMILDRREYRLSAPTATATRPPRSWPISTISWVPIRVLDEPLRIATADGLSDALLVVGAVIALTALVALNLLPRPETAAELPCPRRLRLPAADGSSGAPAGYVS